LILTQNFRVFNVEESFYMAFCFAGEFFGTRMDFYFSRVSFSPPREIFVPRVGVGAKSFLHSPFFTHLWANTEDLLRTGDFLFLKLQHNLLFTYTPIKQAFLQISYPAQQTFLPHAHQTKSCRNSALLPL